MVQGLRIHLPMQGTQTQSLVQEDPTCCRATKPVHHSYRSPRALEPCALQQEKRPRREAHASPLQSGPYSLQLEKTCVQQWRPSTAKNK